MFDNVEKTLGDVKILFYWVKRVARKMPKDDALVRKMSNDTKNTLDKIRKVLGDVGNAKKNVEGCQEKVTSNPKEINQ
jgi:hypothetical protein